MGWAGATATLDFSALGLFLILLLWQFPHFLAISWAYRRDYQKGGFSMLSGADPDGRRTAVRIIVYSLVLFGASLLPATSGLTGDIYLAGAIVLGVALLWLGVRAALVRTIPAARKLSLGTIVYLPLLLILMVLNKM
jgi:protoheme IX farnesyltransferase